MEADQTVTAAPPTSALMVDIYDVQKDFKDNEFAAQQKYFDIVVEVSGGEIEVIKSRLLGGFAVRLSTPTDLDHSVVSCLVDHVQDVIDVSIGDIVTVRGTGGRSGASELDLASLPDCDLRLRVAACLTSLLGRQQCAQFPTTSTRHNPLRVAIRQSYAAGLALTLYDALCG